jgi:hypothetical protein
MMTDRVDELLEAMAEIFEVETSRQDFDKDDRLIGTFIRYKSGFEVYHPYIPLQIYRADGTFSEGWRPTRNDLLMGRGSGASFNRPFRTRYDKIH